MCATKQDERTQSVEEVRTGRTQRLHVLVAREVAGGHVSNVGAWLGRRQSHGLRSRALGLQARSGRLSSQGSASVYHGASTSRGKRLLTAGTCVPRCPSSTPAWCCRWGRSRKSPAAAVYPGAPTASLILKTTLVNNKASQAAGHETTATHKPAPLTCLK